jgi:hypothetical protein
MIEYRQDMHPMVNDHNEVIKFVFVLTGTCTESGTSASVDAYWPIDPDKPKKIAKLWTKDELDLEYGKCEVEKDFRAKVDAKIECKNAKYVASEDFDYNNAPNT